MEKRINTAIKTPGISFNPQGEAAVRLWAPLAKKAALVLDKNKQAIELKAAEHGYWELITATIKPGDRYRFALDDATPLPDPASLAQPDSVHEASMAIDLHQFKWTDATWQNPPMEDYIIYELHIGTFTPEGTFEAVIGKLEHLKTLGITAIEIMPVAQFPGNRNWGYDGVFPYAVQNSYGGAAGLMQLVDACHEQGIAVILDVVYNHMGPEGNYFNTYGPYFTDKYHTPWGNALNFDDAGCNAVREYFIANALMWFRDFHLDALRLDAVHAIKDFSPKHILAEIKENVDELMATTGKVYHLTVEVDLNDTRFIEPLKEKGFGMDAQWIDEFHHALRVTAGGEKDGYYADFKGITHLCKAYRDAYVYDGQYSPHRQRNFGVKAEGRPGEQFIAFSQNHDQVGNRMLGERSSQLFSFEMQKLMAGAVLVSPYVPMLFMGEEWSTPSPFQYFVSHGDPELVKAVREGRKAEFAAFHAEGEPPDPQAVETFERSKLDWDLITSNPHQQMLDYYRTLLSIRKQLPALSKLNREQLSVQVNERANTLILQRWDAQQRVCCLMNFANQQQQLALPEGFEWKPVLDSADVRWNGHGAHRHYRRGH
jgi:maltooligosyltrehalose trehalohydrolase